MKKLLFIFGTRPEGIKLAPLIIKAKESLMFDVVVCNTGQHKEMLDDVLGFFNINVDFNLNVMSSNQTLTYLSLRLMEMINEVINVTKPDIVIVQGDTTSALIGALVSFYNKIPIAHIEAGLRTFDLSSPFPEEANRNLISKISTWHFVPTLSAKTNLENEGIVENVFLVGNTIVDSVNIAKGILDNSDAITPYYFDRNKKNVLITCHRRENFGEPILNICNAILEISQRYRSEVNFIFPVHLNPNILNPVFSRLDSISNVHLLKPLNYPDLTWLLKNVDLIITDSGGIQEEAACFSKNVLILRNETERQEIVDIGLGTLVGSSTSKIIETFEFLIKNESSVKITNPFGKGNSCDLILSELK